MDIRESLVAKIMNADRAGAGALLVEWGWQNGYRKLLPEVLEPVLREIGELWTAPDGISLAQAYIAAKVAEDVIGKIGDIVADPGSDPVESRGPVVIGNIEDDFHALGRRMVGTFLRTDGWDVHDMGNDVPAADLVDQAVAVGAKVIGVSAMMRTTAENIPAVRAELDRRGLTGKIQLAVGGAVFVLRPELVEEVGGDGTAANALAAPALFEKLARRACGEESE
ncbi:MAG: cobalamin-dependent protein [Phycisphaerae bacterium]|nr:cobalamin-dependent protein [Phycisphaerae bacterium]